MKQFLSSRWGGVVLGVLVLAVFVSPFFSFAKSGKTWHVDDGASGTQDGSSKHPFKHIYQATDKADDGDRIDVASGTYEENITIPRGVTVNGSDRGKVTIKADSGKKAVVTMKHKSKLWNVTVKGGKIGVVVKEDASVEIIDSRIVENDHEGIVALKGPKSDKGLMSIVGTEIRDNGWSGVYSERRKITIMDSDIHNNGRNGVALEAGMKGWIKDSSFSGNRENGLFLRLDGSNITLASGNSIRKNRQNGISVQANAAGSLIVKAKTKIVENGRFGVAKAGNASAAVWKGVTLADPSQYFGNASGSISSVSK